MTADVSNMSTMCNQGHFHLTVIALWLRILLACFVLNFCYFCGRDTNIDLSQHKDVDARAYWAFVYLV